jgi:hypothetical protein
MPDDQGNVVVIDDEEGVLPTTDPLDRIGEVVGALDQLHVARCTPPGSERRGRPRCPNWKHDNAERYRLFDAPKKSAGSRRSC